MRSVVPHAGTPRTAKHSLCAGKRKPLRRRVAIRRCMRTCVGMCMARGHLRGRLRVGAACVEEEVSMHEVHALHPVETRQCLTWRR